MASAPEYLPADVRAVWEELSGDFGSGPGFEAFCGQVARLRDAQARISREGLVIADAKGSPVPHPALAIETKAQAEIRAWMKTLAARESSAESGQEGDDEFTRARRERAERAAGA